MGGRMTESEVTRATMAYFAQQEFEIMVGAAAKPKRTTDLICKHQDGRRWRIEAKGMTRNTTIDFNTGLGQLLKGMDDPEAQYGLALPDIRSYRIQAAKIPLLVR